MNHIIEFGTNDRIAIAKNGDYLIFPILKSYFGKCINLDEYKMSLIKIDNVCKSIIETEVELKNWTIDTFDCEKWINLRLKVGNYVKSIEHKQFALLVDGKQIGGTFYGFGNSIKDYVNEIVAFFQKYFGKNVVVESFGSLISLKFLKKSCNYCQKSPSIGLGGYNLVNNNFPNIEKTFLGTVPLPNKYCYEVYANELTEGNIIEIDGRKYVVRDGDNEETIREFYKNGEAYYCSESQPNVSSIAGKRLIENSNSPKIKAIYQYSDGTNDFYKIIVNDVVKGNVFSVDGKFKTALINDTDSTIEAYYNVNGGYYRVNHEDFPNCTTSFGYREVENYITPNVYLALSSFREAGNYDKYQITVGDDIKKGNVFSINELSIVAQTSDTNTSIANKLSNGTATSNIFEMYLPSGNQLILSAYQGFKYDNGDLADVKIVGDGFKCCEKENLLIGFSVDDLDEGCYKILLKNDKDIEISRTNIIDVGTHKDSVLVWYRNPTDVFGVENDGETWQSVRLPIYLKDKKPLITETKLEQIDGGYTRGEVVIEYSREFIVGSMTTDEHDFVLRIFKHGELLIDDEYYLFDGEYLLDERGGQKDIRMARGVLRMINKYSSNLSIS